MLYYCWPRNKQDSGREEQFFFIVLKCRITNNFRGMVRGGKREEGSGWGTHVYLWQIHVDIWQNQHNIVKFKNKIKLKKKEKFVYKTKCSSHSCQEIQY